MFKILTVNIDKPDLSNLKKSLITQYGEYEFFSSPNEADVVKTATSLKPDLIILEINQPDKKSFENFERIKADNLLNFIPVILVSPVSVEELFPRELLRVGTDLFIPKPVNMYQLISTVGLLLKCKKLELEISDEKSKIGKLIYDSTRDLQVKLEEKQNAESKLQSSNKELEISKLATLNLLEDIMTEMDQRKQAEEIMLKRSEELRLSEEKFKKIFEEAPVGKSLTSVDGFLRPNKAFCKLMGYSRKDLKEMNWREFTYPDDIKRNEEIITTILNGKKKSLRWEKRFIRKNGEIIWTDISTTLLRDKDANPLYFITTLIDITEKKRSEEQVFQLNAMLEKRVSERTTQLEEANRELEAFAYSVSHDLRAPLRAIDGFSKFLIESYGSGFDSEGNRLLGLVRTNTLKMDRLITDILALSRVSRSEHRLSEIDMEKMAVSMFNECIASGLNKNVNIVFKPMPHAIGDSTYLKIVWTNLISNAIKFSSGKPNPEIETGGYAENGNNIYYIKDNGVGFNQAYAFKLFGVFQRLHKSEEFEGTGVGLAIVQRIILRHEGKVWAEGKENIGATFYFSLPVKRI